MTPVLDLEIHELPSLYNVFMRKHHMKQYGERNHWIRIIYLPVLRSQCADLMLQSYRLELVRHSSKEPDYDGLVGSFKLVVDALRHAKVLADDKLSNSGPWNVSWVKCAKNQGKIEVRVYAA